MPRTPRSRTVTYKTQISCTGSAVYSTDYQAAAYGNPISKVVYSYAGLCAPRSRQRVVDNGADYLVHDSAGHSFIYRRGTKTTYIDYGWVDSSHDPFATSGTFWRMGSKVISSVDYDTGTTPPTPVIPFQDVDSIDYYINKFQLFTWTVTGTVTKTGTMYETVQFPFNGYEGNALIFGEEAGTDWVTTVDLPGVDDAGLVTIKPDVTNFPGCGGTTNAHFVMHGVDGTEDHPNIFQPTVAQAAYFNANQAPLGGAVSATFHSTVSGPGMAYAPAPPSYSASGCTVSMGSVSVKSPEQGAGYSADGLFFPVLDQTVALNARNQNFEREDTVARSLWFLLGVPDPGADSTTSDYSAELARAKPLTVTGHGTRTASPRGSRMLATVYAPTGSSTNGNSYSRPAPTPSNAVVPYFAGALLSVRDNSEKSASNPPFGIVPTLYQTTFGKTVSSIGIWQQATQDLESAPFTLGTTVPAEARPKASVWTGTNVTLTGGSGPLHIVVGSSGGGAGSAWTRYRATASPQLYIRNGYRRYRIRIRSIGSANQPFSPVFCEASTGVGSVEPRSAFNFGTLTTGDDGEWVERLVDLLDLPPLTEPFTKPYDARIGFAPEHPLTGFRLDKLAPGTTYELEFVRGERIAESLVNVWGNGAVLTDDPVQVQNLHILHALTDGMVSLNIPTKLSNAPGSHVIKIGQVIDLINAQPWTGWRATDLNPPTAGRAARAAANTLTVEDFHDSTGMPASFLESTGFRPDLSLALDMNVTANTAASPYTLKASYQALSVTLYPGAGDAMGGGGYGVTSSLDFRRVVGSQVFGVVVVEPDEDGDTVVPTSKIQVRDGATGAIKGSGVVRASGTYTTNTPSMPERALGPSGSGNPPTPPPGYWAIRDTDGSAQTFIPSGDKTSATWVLYGTGFGGFFDYYNGTTYTESFPNRTRRWLPWWTVGQPLPGRSPRNLNTRQGGYYANAYIRGEERAGRVFWRRTNGLQVSRSEEFPVKAYASTPSAAAHEGDAEPWPWYDVRDSSAHVFFTRCTYNPDGDDPDTPTATAVREAVSHDDGATWTDSETATNARHPFALVEPGGTGGTLRAWFVPDSGIADGDPITGTIVGTWQAAGDPAPSDPFTLQYYDMGSSSLVPLSVQDDNFALTCEAQSQGKFALHVLIAGETGPSRWSSSDGGRTFTRDS